MKKTYIMPAMQVLKIQQQGLICASPGVKSLISPDGFTLTDKLDEDDV